MGLRLNYFNCRWHIKYFSKFFFYWIRNTVTFFSNWSINLSSLRNFTGKLEAQSDLVQPCGLKRLDIKVMPALSLLITWAPWDIKWPVTVGRYFLQLVLQWGVNFCWSAHIIPSGFLFWSCFTTLFFDHILPFMMRGSKVPTWWWYLGRNGASGRVNFALIMHSLCLLIRNLLCTPEK